MGLAHLTQAVSLTLDGDAWLKVGGVNSIHLVAIEQRNPVLGAGADRVTGGMLADTLVDTLVGRGGADGLFGGFGNDDITVSGPGFVVDGGGGSDRLTLLPGAVCRDLTRAGGALAIGGAQQVVTGIASLTARIEGHGATIAGGDGVEDIPVIGGAMTASGGNGNDHFLLRGSGALRGDDGAGGLDMVGTVPAGAGSAAIRAETSGSVLSAWGDGGDDRIEACAGGVRIDGGAGNGMVTAAIRFDGQIVDGGLGDDRLTAQVWAEGAAAGGGLLLASDAQGWTVSTGSFSAALTGFERIELAARASSDKLNGKDGADLIHADFIWQEGGMAGGGNDVLRGRGGDDRLYGRSGDDTCFGGFGRDRLCGDAGDDSLDAGLGSDTMTGGAGGTHFASRRSTRRGWGQPGLHFRPCPAHRQDRPQPHRRGHQCSGLCLQLRRRLQLHRRPGSSPRF